VSKVGACPLGVPAIYLTSGRRGTLALRAEVVPTLVEVEVAVPRLTPAMW
jgi:hypothetical protein